MSALVEVPELVNVGPNCQTYIGLSPCGPTVGTELCCNIWVEPQSGLLGSLGVVVSGLTTRRSLPRGAAIVAYATLRSVRSQPGEIHRP